MILLDLMIFMEGVKGVYKNPHRHSERSEESHVFVEFLTPDVFEFFI